jgi:chromate reductase, NAD(P)H dehydrogenase (quinone)
VQESLKEMLTTMSGNIIEKAYVSILLLSSELDVVGIMNNEDIANALKAGLGEFCREIESQKRNKHAN